MRFKMPFKAKYSVDFTIKNNRIHLSTDYLLANNKKFKKITGSRLASIINRNQYTSPAKMWAMMTNIYYEEMDETMSRENPANYYGTYNAGGWKDGNDIAPEHLAE